MITLQHQLKMKKAACRFLVLFGFLRLAQCVIFGKHVYIDIKRTWSMAREYCREHHTDLSSIDSEEEDLALGRFETVLPQIWIGLYKDAGGSWTWTAGTKPSYFKWAAQDNENGKNCAARTTKGWRPMQCETERHFFCFQSGLVLVREARTWEAAAEHCRHSNMELMSLLSQSELAAALHSSKTAQTGFLWTSLRYLGNSWLWADRSINASIIGYRDWGPWEMPRCPAWNHHCGVLSIEGELLDSWDCADTLSFLCY